MGAIELTEETPFRWRVEQREGMRVPGIVFATTEVLPGSSLDLVYDVSHNMAKIEEHAVDGRPRRLCVHRKGATRALPPGHEELPDDLPSRGSWCAPAPCGASRRRRRSRTRTSTRSSRRASARACAGASRGCVRWES